MEKQNIVKGNRLGCFFECGCMQDANTKRTKDRKLRGVCPIHRERIAGYVYKCFSCGRIFRKKVKRSGRCPDCVKDHKLWYTFDNYRKKKAANGGKPPTQKPKPKRKRPMFYQSKRGDCKFGQYCLNRQIYNKEEFNCYGCRRFETKKYDIMDFMTSSDSRWGDTMKYEADKSARGKEKAI